MDIIINKLILMFCLSVSVGICQTVTEAPVHTAGIIGDQIRFNYSANAGETSDSIKWSFYDESSGSPTLRTIYTSAQGLTADALPYFEVDDAATNQYDLIVLSAEVKLAGQYYAGFAINDQDTVHPQLVVLSEMTCHPNPPGTVVDDGNYINYVCSVIFTGYKKPRLRWMDQDGHELSAIWHEDAATRTLTLTANMTAAWELHDHVMTCHLDFVMEEGEVDEPPSFRHYCQTYHEVAHHPSQITIHPNPDNGPLTMYEGEQINCTANGNPDPMYKWYCNGVYHSEGQIIYVEGDLVQGSSAMNSCNCTAKNYIDGVAAGYFKSVYFYAYQDPDVNDSGSAAVAGVIAAALIIPLIVVGGVLIAGLYRRFT